MAIAMMRFGILAKAHAGIRSAAASRGFPGATMLLHIFVLVYTCFATGFAWPAYVTKHG